MYCVAMNLKLLIVDDEASARDGLAALLRSDDRHVDVAGDGVAALERLAERSYHVMITDIRMPRMGGMELLKNVRERYPDVETIVVTAYGEIRMAVEAMNLGAFWYLTKPVDVDELEALVLKAAERRRLRLENRFLRAERQPSGALQQLVGSSPAMMRLHQQIAQVAATKANVLITGESGTGKELVTRALHELSPRRDALLVPVHCAALPENLLESELFGHERGAFTGAASRRAGRFEMADGGTLFLDEISEIPLNVQVKLLRVLQERSFERVGGNDTIHVDIRIIAATNTNLAERVQEGTFREDLYYRLRVVTLEIPPLRARATDVPMLVEHFSSHFAREHGGPLKNFESEALERLMSAPWPGNVRELQGLIERLVILAPEPVIGLEQLPTEYAGIEPRPANIVFGETDVTVADMERDLILATLQRYEGNRTKTAQILGIGRRTLIRKLQDYRQTGVSVPGDDPQEGESSAADREAEG